MALIVEDGSNVADANSYVDTQFATAYAAVRGLVLPSDTTELAQLLVRAFDYIESQRSRFQGVKTYPYGGSQWPRTGVTIDGTAIDPQRIPTELKQAQIRIAVELNNGVDVQPTVGEVVTEETVGPITTKYATGTIGPIMTAVDALLAPLYMQSGGFSLRTIRG